MMVRSPVVAAIWYQCEAPSRESVDLGGVSVGVMGRLVTYLAVDGGGGSRARRLRGVRSTPAVRRSGRAAPACAAPPLRCFDRSKGPAFVDDLLRTSRRAAGARVSSRQICQTWNLICVRNCGLMTDTR